jgi:tetratricopeptide (TPR) repeat protein
MPNLPALVEELAHHEQLTDHAAMRRVREAIVAEFPNTPEAAEARYKVGLDALFRERDILGACGHLEEAAKSGHPYWGAAARTSLGLCYYHQKRLQKALFELRKVAYVRDANEHSVTALMFLENILHAEHKTDDAARVRKERVGQLEALLGGKTPTAMAPAERGQYLYQLALALLDLKERGRAKAALTEALALGAQALGPELWQNLNEAKLRM